MSSISRADALTIIRGARLRLDELIEGITHEQLKAPATLGGGDWSLKDLIGHLASWENRALALAGVREPPASPSHLSMDEFNAAEVARKRDWPLDLLREDAQRMHSSLLETLDAMSDEKWPSKLDVPGEGRAALCEMLGGVLGGGDHGPFAHDLAHLHDVEAYVQSLSGGRLSSH